MVNYCRACKSRTLSHDFMLQYHSCTQVVNIKCMPLTRDEYKHINDRNCAWLCGECSDDTIPLYHIDEEEEFIESLYAFCSYLPIDLCVISNMIFMIFDPFSTNENLNSPLLDNDPDVNFSNDIQRPFVDNSPYLYEDLFNTCLSKLADHPNFGLFHITIRSLAALKKWTSSIVANAKLPISNHWIDWDMAHMIQPLHRLILMVMLENSTTGIAVTGVGELESLSNLTFHIVKENNFACLMNSLRPYF